MFSLERVLVYRPFVYILFLINLLGTIYGFYWYIPQLEMTPPIFLPFVPDSPTASLFFTIFLLFFLFRRSIPYIEALAVTSLIKYGVWAVVMNVFTFYIEGTISTQGIMLIASHAGMALQGLLYMPYYKMKLKHLSVAAIVLLHNDIIDYVYEMMPIYGALTNYMKEIGYFTFWLSIFTILLTYYLMRKYEQNT